jgi:hypothetical protein
MFIVVVYRNRFHVLSKTIENFFVYRSMNCNVFSCLVRARQIACRCLPLPFRWYQRWTWRTCLRSIVFMAWSWYSTAIPSARRTSCTCSIATIENESTIDESHTYLVLPFDKEYLSIGSFKYLTDHVDNNERFRHDHTCQTLIYEAMRYHLAPDKRTTMRSIRTKARQSTLGTLYCLSGLQTARSNRT